MGTWPEVFLARSVAGLRGGQGLPPDEAWLTGRTTAAGAERPVPKEAISREVRLLPPPRPSWQGLCAPLKPPLDTLASSGGYEAPPIP